MSCTRERELIVLLLCGELDESARVALRAHLAGCAECAAFRAVEERLLGDLAERGLEAETDLLLPACRRDLAAALAPAWRRIVAGPLALRLAAPVLGAAMLAGGFLIGRLTAAPVTTGASTAGQAMVRDIGLLEDAPGRPRVRLSYDTLRQDALEGSARDPEIRRLLVGTMRDNLNAGLRLQAIDALRGQADDVDVRAALLRAVGEDDNPGARLKALEALQPSVGHDPAVRDAVVRTLLSDGNPGVRVRAVDALGATRDPVVLPVLQHLASGDRNDYVRLRAATLVSDLAAGEERR